MGTDAFGAALAGFRRWTKTAKDRMLGDPAQDVAEMRVVLDLMRDYLEIDHPAELTVASLNELLLQVYPRKITVLDESQTVDTIPAMSDFLAFLAESGELTEARARELDRELGAIAPRFGAAVMDPANWGMARSFLTAMAADGIDLEDKDDIQRWIAGYNARIAAGSPYDDEDEDDEDDGPELDLKEAFGLPDELPPVRLPPAAELAAMARQVPVIAQLRTLTAWLGEQGREVDQDGDLLPGDVPAAAAAVGIDPGELPYLWDLALESDFAALDENELEFLDDDELDFGADEDLPEDAEDAAGPGGEFSDEGDGEDDLDDEDFDDKVRAVVGDTALEWEEYEDDRVLASWQIALGATLLRTLDVAAELDTDRSRSLDLTGHGIALMTMLFLTSGRGIPVAEASEVMRETATDELPPAQAEQAWQEWTGAHGDPLRLLLRQLAGLGAIGLTEDPGEGELIVLTPLGRFAVRNLLIDSGVDVPLLPDVEEMTAADLLAMAAGASEEEFDATRAEWMGYRTPENAACELLAAAVGADPAQRILAVGVITELGAPAEPAWRECLGEVALRGYAKTALARLAGQEIADDLGAEELAWMTADTLALAGLVDVGDEHDPAALARLLGEVVPRGQEQNAFEMMARLPHRQVTGVLTVIGRHHPDKRTAKLARRAAYKAGTRQAARRG